MTLAALVLLIAVAWIAASLIVAVADWRRSPEEREARNRQMAMAAMTREADRYMEWVSWSGDFRAAWALRSRVGAASNRETLVALIPDIITFFKGSGLAGFLWLAWGRRWKALDLGPAPLDFVASERQRAFDVFMRESR